MRLIPSVLLAGLFVLGTFAMAGPAAADARLAKGLTNLQGSQGLVEKVGYYGRYRGYGYKRYGYKRYGYRRGYRGYYGYKRRYYRPYRGFYFGYYGPRYRKYGYGRSYRYW